MVSNQDMLITCRVCNAKVPVSQMRLGPNGKDMLCRPCIEKQQMRAGALGSKAAQSMKASLAKSASAAPARPSMAAMPAKQATMAKPAVTTRPALKSTGSAKPAAKTKSMSDMVNYFCQKCRYKFARKSEFPVTKCPYCGSDKLETTDKYSAESLIRQARPEDDF